MAVNLEKILYGLLEIEFVGTRKTRTVEVVDYVLNGNDNLMYLVSVDGTIYNWDNIIKLKKLSDQ